VLACRPRLVAVRPALEVVPGMHPQLVLHAGPPSTWEALSPVLQAGVAGAAALEGLSLDRVVLGAAQDHAAMAGGAGTITASTPVMVVEDEASGRRAFHFLMEGFGRTLVLGMTGDDVFERLRWLRDVAAPALDAALQELGGIDCDEIMVEALRRGDELHNRNAAATSLLAERLAPGFALARVDAAVQERLFAFVRGNPQFFVPVSLAASLLMLAAGHGIEGSTLVTAMGANGRDCGIRVSGLGDKWFVAPAEVPQGALLDGFAAEDAGPGCGDSLLVECAGLGASVLPAAPALWPALGVDEARAREVHERARSIALAEHPRYRVPALGDRGAPVGVDLLRVLESGHRPLIDIVMIHREAGLGMVGLGLTSPPAACFEQAAQALARR
jgi:CheY-like chemotaxis protein